MYESYGYPLGTQTICMRLVGSTSVPFEAKAGRQTEYPGQSEIATDV